MRRAWLRLCPARTEHYATPFERLTRLAVLLWAVAMGVVLASFAAGAADSSPSDSVPAWLAPSAVAATSDGKLVLVACARGRQLLLLDAPEGRATRSIQVAGEPSGIVLAPDQRRLYMTCSGPQSRMFELDLTQGAVAAEWKTGHTAMGPTLSPDGKTLYICLRYENQVAAFDLGTRREVARIQVGREPVSAAAAPDGRFLFVAHHLPAGPADGPGVAATVGVVELRAGKMIKELRPPNGSSLMRQIRFSPDGRQAVVTHNLAHYQLPTTQLERGWMNTSALTIIDVAKQEILDTVLLDDVDRGAANPWDIAWSADGQQLLVTHAGTHELSIIQYPGLLAKLAEWHAKKDHDTAPCEDLAFLVGLRRRVKLSGEGPRSLAVSGQTVYIADYFSDKVEALDISRTDSVPRVIALRGESAESVLRKGERLFNDATICFQGWQSCASCHSEDARVDGLNWDLLNDGIGNPKNTKSLLLAHATPPAMSTGVRLTTEEAVRAGIQHILFAEPTEERARPLDEWLKSLKPMPSPHLVNGRLSPAARRGEKIFRSSRTGCKGCHPPGLFTDLKSYDVGTTGPRDQGVRQFDTPTLVELWRTAPYLHDGSAATLHDALTSRNPEDRHGRVSQLSPKELDDLVEYLLSL